MARTIHLKFFLKLTLVMMPFFANASPSVRVDEDRLFEHLDSFIAKRDMYVDKKEKKLGLLKHELQGTSAPLQRLRLYNQIYKEYYTFRYDSAVAYANRGLHLAEQVKNDYYIQLNKINRATVLSMGGFYSQAEDLMLSMDAKQLPVSLRQYYYYTLAWVYNYWASFCENSEFKQAFVEKDRENLIQSIRYLGNKNAALYHYFCGEIEYLKQPNSRKGFDCYQKALAASTVNTRVYASASYCVARYYLSIGKEELYEKYLVEAAISDIVCPLKENLALQELSTYLYNKSPKYAKRAARYIKCSMEDAQFYNNRLRMVEISRILPLITEANHQAEVRQKLVMRISLIVVSCISLGFLVLAFFTFKQNKKLAKSRHEVKSQNELLEELNGKLLNTNKLRETYMRLFMDISAVYINKLNDYRKLVSRKIKAKQTADLLTAINSYKLAEEEAANFYIRFDKAFMELYPNFVDELNLLLRTDKQIVLPAPNSLTKEVRIYALMRLGVTDGQELATLLFYSTQTIYNYKSAMRRRAQNVETFDEDVNQLCHVINR